MSIQQKKIRIIWENCFISIQICFFLSDLSNQFDIFSSFIIVAQPSIPECVAATKYEKTSDKYVAKLYSRIICLLDPELIARHFYLDDISKDYNNLDNQSCFFVCKTWHFSHSIERSTNSGKASRPWSGVKKKWQMWRIKKSLFSMQNSIQSYCKSSIFEILDRYTVLNFVRYNFIVESG